MDVERGGEQGILEAEEEQMINAVIELGSRRVHEVMVPRIAMAAMPASATIDEAIETIVEHGHSRIPVYDESVDEILGILDVPRAMLPEIRASNRQTRSLGERLAVNSVMQGTAADVIKKAMVAIHRRLREEGRAARLVLQVHDELLLEVPDAETSAVKELVREEMSNAFPLDPPLGVDIGTGDDWNDAKR